MIIAIGNVGSTSLKTRILDVDDDNSIRVLGEANIDRVKSPDASNFTHAKGDSPRQTEQVELVGFEAGIRHVLDWYVSEGVITRPDDIEAMGFKCVMGRTNGANMLTPAILDEMREYAFLAPAHNPPYLEAIGEFRKVLDVPMVGVFEPSFYHAIPEFRRCGGLPWRWHEMGIKKLGYHGASHRYLSAVATKLMGPGGKVITVHLGGSSSMSAIDNGKAIDNSFRFSTCSGLLQGTRIGDADASAVLFAMKELGLSIEEAQEELSHEAGLKGLAGIGTEDCRAIEQAAEAGNERAQLALDVYVDSIRKTIGSYGAILGGVDCIIFGGGIGENSDCIRRRCLENLQYMGIELDRAANGRARGVQAEISAEGSRVKVYVVPTNEELIVACFTKRVVDAGRDLLPEEMTFKL